MSATEQRISRRTRTLRIREKNLVRTCRNHPDPLKFSSPKSCRSRLNRLRYDQVDDPGKCCDFPDSFSLGNKPGDVSATCIRSVVCLDRRMIEQKLPTP